MNDFLKKHSDKIAGVLSCHDRVQFKGYLKRISYAKGMQDFLASHGFRIADFAKFVEPTAKRLTEFANELARDSNRPILKAQSPKQEKKHARAHTIAEKDGITHGLVCILWAVEPCMSFQLCYGKGKPFLRNAQRKCKFFYFYFIHPEYGLIHIRLQTWFPFTIQVWINGHDWLAHQLDKNEIRYSRLQNAFSYIEDFPRTQKIADSFILKPWPEILQGLARRVNPLLEDLLEGFEYYWVIEQSEFSTDIVFRSREDLAALYQKLLSFSVISLSAEDVFKFLGKKLHWAYQGEILTELRKRLPGACVRHRVGRNTIKMYDKGGLILRIETVINDPAVFQVYRYGTRQGLRVKGWFPLRKGVGWLYRYQQIALACNRRYLDALTVIDDPQSAYNLLHELTRPATYRTRRKRALNPLSKQELTLFSAVARGSHIPRGFRNSDLLQQLYPTVSNDRKERKLLAGRVTRLIQLLRAHGLIAKIPHARRYTMTRRGLKLMHAAIHLYKEDMPQLLNKTVA